MTEFATTVRNGVALGDTEPHLESLLCALNWLDILLERAVGQMQAAREPAQTDPYHGLYISQDEVQRLLAGEPARALCQPSDAGDLLDLAGEGSRLARLVRIIGLCSFEVALILIGLAPEVDPRYERLYAYLQDDMTRRHPTVDLALSLLCPSLRTKLAARRYLAPAAPLLRYQLLRLLDDPQDHQPPLLGKYLKVDERIVDYLLGADNLDARLLPYARLIAPEARLDDLLMPAEMKHRLALLARNRGEQLICYFQGPYGVGKQTSAAALCRELGVGLLAVDGAGLLHSEGTAFETSLRLFTRDAALQGAALYWEGFDALLADDRRSQRNALLAELVSWGGTSFLAGNTAWEPADPPPGLRFVRIELPRSTAAQRARLWALALGNQRPTTNDQRPTTNEEPAEARYAIRDTLYSIRDTQDTGLDSSITTADLADLAGKFRMSAGQIRDAVATARGLARWRGPESAHVTMADLNAACRLQSNPKLAALAKKIEPQYVWDDIVLPTDRLGQLREICDHMRFRARVHDDWGFGRKLALGKGLNVLFAGPSGTGKTMAAEIIAGDLRLDLYKIDLATVVSKYIGETEKNLARIFAEAESSNAILFFDEADALFGKRSEVKDAHDRYANLEVAYLLQRMEEYEGVTILATNLRKNMDEAFVRRMRFIVEFPFPNERDRWRIWQQVWPRDLPRDPALDLALIARRCEIAGGNIRNIALAAAFLAAADGGVVTMEHLVRATRREYQKMGKVVGEGDFGEYGRYERRDTHLVD